MTSEDPEMEHQPNRPAWDCADCGESWPCPSRRAALLGEFLPERLGLFLFMSRLMVDAIDDFFTHGTGRVQGLHDRFLGWVPWADPAADSRECERAHRRGPSQAAA
jgi:hypothetical protein